MADEEHERILECLAKTMAEDAMALLVGAGALHAPRPTALRVSSSGAIEVVELYEDGSIVEPCPRCGPVLKCPKHLGT